MINAKKNKICLDIFDHIQIYNNLIKQTHNLLDNCFEFQFTDPGSFKAIIFLVVCFRNGFVKESNLGKIFEYLKLSEDIFLDTILLLFNMHEQIIPDEFMEVLSFLSKIFPESSFPIKTSYNPKKNAKNNPNKKIFDEYYEANLTTKTENNKYKIFKLNQRKYS